MVMAVFEKWFNLTSPSRLINSKVSPNAGGGEYSGSPAALAIASIFTRMSWTSKPPTSRPVVLRRAANATNNNASKDVENETAATSAMLKDS